MFRAAQFDVTRFRLDHAGVADEDSAMLRTAAALSLVCALAGCNRDAQRAARAGTLRIGYFPNLTHAAAMVALGRGSLQRALGPSVTIDAKLFNAGPEAMEALFAGALDACYVGPMPALNGYLRSRGEALTVVAGAASGGAGFVVREGAHIDGPEALHGKRIASPQLGNTQDIALRRYLADHGLKAKEHGGDVLVLPIANPDILSLMKSGQLDGAWVPEPWVTRLLHEAGGRLLVDERDRWPERRFPTALLVVTRALAAEHPDRVRALAQANAEAVDWIAAHPDEARALVADALKQRGQKPLPPDQMAEAWSRLDVTADPMERAIDRLAADAERLGYLPRPSMERQALPPLVDHRFLAAAPRDGGP
jgi:NitT/TauT family transport system substrate-binding protein